MYSLVSQFLMGQFDPHFFVPCALVQLTSDSFCYTFTIGVTLIIVFLTNMDNAGDSCLIALLIILSHNMHLLF